MAFAAAPVHVRLQIILDAVATQTQKPPEGFLLSLDFVDAAAEEELVRFLAGLPFGEVRMHGVTARRRVAQFGWRYAFESYRLTPAGPLPDELLDVRRNAAAVAGIEAEEFGEALVTEYPPGAGIGWHRDAPHFGIVAGVSLGVACRMRFRRGEGEGRETTAVELPPRSLYLLTGAARSAWQHTIRPVRATRWSITFRTLRKAGR